MDAQYGLPSGAMAATGLMEGRLSEYYLLILPSTYNLILVASLKV